LVAAIEWKARIIERLAGSEPRHAAADWLLPGLSREQTHAYGRLLPENLSAAAVLMPLIERAGELSVLLTQRAVELKSHAGQISFPGGRLEANESPLQAALREAREEIGLDPSYVSLAGYLPDHVLLSGFRVTPVVGFVSSGFELLLASNEVQGSFEVPLNYVFDPANHRTRLRRLADGAAEIELCDISFGIHHIWGATAGMLITLYRLCTSEALP
jgi:8-oxo-dGTP pyrophosphatase MutT (NUDIX family)